VNPWSTPAPWWLAVAGWSVLVALWHTSVVALAFATWRRWQHAAQARTQYAAAASALGLATALTLATPAMLLIGSRTVPPIPTTQAPTMTTISATPAATAPGASSLVDGPVAWRETGRAVTTSAAPWIGAAWCLGFAIGLIRLCGGWGVAQWIRRRATAVSSAQLVDAARDAAAAWSLPAAPVLASAHVEAPVVIGARVPAVLLPLDLEQRLDADALRPLLAHELAHVDRRDYAANLLQSLADTLLFFSPGARWLSRSVREAREYCCDDLVAAHCGVGAYASALTTLAGLGVAARARPAVNAAGPRLIVRIRRLLREDTMTPFAGFRLAGLIVASALVASAGVDVMPLSAGGVAAAGLASGPPVRVVDGALPMGFLASQPGSALRLRAMTPTDAGLCGTAEIENLANVPITGLRFVAFAYTPAAVPPSSLMSASFASSPMLPADIAPQQAVTMAVDLLTPTEARERLRAPAAQIMCGVAEIRYANGAHWEMRPATVFGPEHADVSREQIGRPGSGGDALCRDEAGGQYSEGAVLPIRLEPMRFARCFAGAWHDYQLPVARQGTPFVWMDFVIPGGHRPSLGVEPGNMARLNVKSGSWGFTPTLDPADERLVRLEVYDLQASPAVRVADLSLSVGEEPVKIPSFDATVRIRSTRNP
jgi:beta-lactamase regulating signal transducer with metallopeptidase domain